MYDVSGRHLPLKLGKLPARPDAILFRVADYLDITRVPRPPASFGNYLRRYERFDGNLYGNCVWSGAANETMDWYNDVGKEVRFTTEGVLSDYSAVTGFVRGDPTTDLGTDMGEAASYRRRIGIVAADGSRHRVEAYVRVPLHRLDWIRALTYLTGGVGLGFQFPANAMEQFQRGVPWSYERGSPLQGGHYVPVLGIAPNHNLVTQSWGRLQEMEPTFAAKYMDEVIGWLDLDRTKDKISPEGFNEAALRSDLAACGQVQGLAEEGYA